MKTLFYGLLTTLFTGYANAAPTLLVPADNASLVYSGRIDWRKPDEPVLVWQGSSVSLNFTKGYLAIGFSDLDGDVYFDLTLNGDTRVLTARDGWVEIPVADGEHRLELRKRSEADAGHVSFIGFKLHQHAEVTAPPPPKGPKFIFYGDSITVGANNEDGEVDQWEDRSTHNNNKSYATFVAQHFGAQYQNLAVSGMGIVTGYVPVTAGQVWNRHYPKPHAPLAPVADWQADWVFLNFGENDDSFTKNQNQPFPQNFVGEYIALVEAMRAAYPQSILVLLRGGMSGGSQSDRLIPQWQAVVDQLQAKDPKIHHYAFQHWTPHHPRVSDHRKMADELIGWLEKRQISERARTE